MSHKDTPFRPSDASRAEAGKAIAAQYRRQAVEGTVFSCALVILSLVLIPLGGWAWAASAALTIGVIWMSFAASSVLLASAAPRAVDSLILLGMGVYVLKIFVVGMLVIAIGVPGWFVGLPAGVAAIVGVVGWQLIQFRAQSRARVPLYSQ